MSIAHSCRRRWRPVSVSSRDNRLTHAHLKTTAGQTLVIVASKANKPQMNNYDSPHGNVTLWSNTTISSGIHCSAKKQGAIARALGALGYSYNLRVVLFQAPLTRRDAEH